MSYQDRYRSKARALLADVPIEERMETLAKSRFSCEARWMMAVVSAAGWDMANRMNLEVGADVSEGEMHRLMRLLGKGSPGTDEEFLELVGLAMELFTTKKYFDYEIRFIGPGKMLGVVHSCLANTKVRSIGAEDFYECGCFGMRAGWYRAMGVEVEESLIKCMVNGEDRCEVLVEYEL